MSRSTQNPFQAGLAAADAGDYAGANSIARALLARNRRDVHAYQILGYAAFRQGRSSEALQAFQAANAIEPDQPALLFWLGLLHKERGDNPAARRALESAVRINPKYGEAWCMLGETLYQSDNKNEATQAFERALSAEPDSARVQARAAKHFETIHDMARARELAETAFKRDPRDVAVQISLADIRLRDMEFGKVLDIVRPLLAGDQINTGVRARLNHIAGVSFERLGRFDEAFAAFSQANRLQKSIEPDIARTTPSVLHQKNLERLTSYLEQADMSFWSAPRILSGAAPVFLVGFVRSGTTWLDQILSSHPDIAVMEEHDHFVDASRDLVIADGELDRIGALSDAQINAYRNAYWRRAEAVLKDDIARPLIIDKAPLNTAQLPLIARLFPEARIIFALRDPRDCVMSAFQQYFQLNVGMAYFLDMQTSAVFYDKVMTIGELTRRKSNLVFHEVRYERVVENFDAEVAAVLNFLGVEWDDSVRDYRETAKRRAVNTPSLRQVIQKPYATSIGKWRNYRDGMASALPVLAPWVEKFGYDAD